MLRFVECRFGLGGGRSGDVRQVRSDQVRVALFSVVQPKLPSTP